MIGIIDLDTGNIASLISAFDKINSKYRICKKPEDLIGVNKIVLPGVAAFKDYHQKIINKNFDKALIESKSKNYPILGICSGFQVFFEQSTEHGLSEGLGFLKGKFKAFNETDQKIQVPHVGWTSCKIAKKSKIFENINNNSDFYFTHSFFLYEENNEIQTTVSKYDKQIFTSSINKNNLYGVQFHPEKSQLNGLQVLKNFSEL
tara:strand:- start:379 stop:990 length:612 start_codon:yes stop_codon:yes gene_type:complete